MNKYKIGSAMRFFFLVTGSIVWLERALAAVCAGSVFLFRRYHRHLSRPHLFRV